jgi:hypothetical protein
MYIKPEDWAEVLTCIKTNLQGISIDIGDLSASPEQWLVRNKRTVQHLIDNLTNISAIIEVIKQQKHGI